MRFEPSEYGEDPATVRPESYQQIAAQAAGLPAPSAPIDTTSQYIKWGKAAMGWDKDVLQQYHAAQGALKTAKEAYTKMPNMITRAIVTQAEAKVEGLRPLAREAQIVAIAQTTAWISVSLVGISAVFYFGSKAVGSIADTRQKFSR